MRWFLESKSDIVLVFTGSDAFQEKLTTRAVKVSTFFPDYRGDNSYESALTYFKQKFAAVTSNGGRCSHVAVINALDTAEVKQLMEQINKLANTRMVGGPVPHSLVRKLLTYLPCRGVVVYM